MEEPGVCSGVLSLKEGSGGRASLTAGLGESTADGIASPASLRSEARTV